MQEVGRWDTRLILFIFCKDCSCNKFQFSGVWIDAVRSTQRTVKACFYVLPPSLLRIGKCIH